MLMTSFLFELVLYDAMKLQKDGYEGMGKIIGISANES